MGIVCILTHELSNEESRALLDLKERSASWDFDIWICDDEIKGQKILSENKPLIGYESSKYHLSFHYLALSFDGITEDYARLVYMRAMGIPRIILKTKRYTIREFSLSDLDELFKLYEKPGITDFVEPLFSYDEEKAYQENYIYYIYDMKEYGMWLVTDSTGNIVGRVGLEDKGEYEKLGLSLGYIIAPEYQRTGAAYETCSAILDMAVKNGEKRFYASIDPRNIPSVKLATKLGFKPSNNTDGEKETIFTKIVN
ncbi:MAG: GNAT family N-acetyltransferase [Lachnospiraceae bacterium]|nr:GNAT family N-acetyltransferase [Lachnospiraceae bacterium]